jgi:hypothetical protein
MAKSNRQTDYQERVLPGLWFYAATLVVPGTIFLISLPFGENIALPASLISVLPIWIASWVAAPKIIVSKDRLQVGRAVIDRSFLGQAQALSPNESFVARGANLSPHAYTRFQPAVKGLVRVPLNDPRDKVPYWIFSTRNPEILVQRLNKKS